VREQEAAAQVLGASLLWGGFDDGSVPLGREAVDVVDSVARSPAADLGHTPPPVASHPGQPPLPAGGVVGSFVVPAGHPVLHMMGEPDQTRPLWVADRQAVLSPPWSIHCGCGTASYRFVWAMGGENQAFTDMDRVAIGELR